MSDIWKLVRECPNCTDTSPCESHEQAVLEAFLADREVVQANTYHDLMGAAFDWAINSPDPSTQNSAFLIYPDNNIALETLAVNEFPRDVQQSDERWTRPTKYYFVEHAERNAIYRACREGIKTEGMGLVSPWASCADCARAIIQAGITTLVRYHHDTAERWNASITAGDEMFEEAGVAIITIRDPYPNVKPLRFNGELWTPQGV